jgi:DNA replication ATP-dependent helicase Dna2
LLQDDWIETPFEADDFANLIGEFNPDLTPAMQITRNEGSLILHPDILVSSTKVADSAHCARKALLQELIRTSAGTGSASPSLVYGNMIHELMQSAMIEQKWDDEWRRKKIQDIVAEQVGQLWTMDLSVDRAVETMMDKSKELEAFSALFVGENPKVRRLASSPVTQRVQAFADLHSCVQPEAVLSDLRATKSEEARLAITSTLSVEEDIWSPRYGLKGKIDISVRSKLQQGEARDQTTREGALPFEIKTGRTSAASEHRAQTMLYTLLMSDRYGKPLLLLELRASDPILGAR